MHVKFHHQCAGVYMYHSMNIVFREQHGVRTFFSSSPMWALGIKLGFLSLYCLIISALTRELSQPSFVYLK